MTEVMMVMMMMMMMMPNDKHIFQMG